MKYRRRHRSFLLLSALRYKLVPRSLSVTGLLLFFCSFFMIKKNQLSVATSRAQLKINSDARIVFRLVFIVVSPCLCFDKVSVLRYFALLGAISNKKSHNKKVAALYFLFCDQIINLMLAIHLSCHQLVEYTQDPYQTILNVPNRT